MGTVVNTTDHESHMQGHLISPIHETKEPAKKVGTHNGRGRGLGPLTEPIPSDLNLGCDGDGEGSSM